MHARLQGIVVELVDPPTSVDEAIQALDVELAVGCTNDWWCQADYDTPHPGISAVIKQTRLMVKQAKQRIDVEAKYASVEENRKPPESGVDLANSIMAVAAASKPLSEKDAKYAEEIEASRIRSVNVAAKQSLIALVERLAEQVGPQSDLDGAQKLKALAVVSEESLEVASLLHSSQVRPPHSKRTHCVTHCVTQVYMCYRKHTC